MNFFEDYENKVVRQICKILRYIFLVFPILLILSIAGIFQISFSYFYTVIPLGFIVCYLPSFLYKLNISKKHNKYISILSIGIIICILSANRDVGIYITFILMPLIATMYFDKKFTISISVLGYLLMAIGLYFRSPGMASLEAIEWEGKVMGWYVSHLMGFTIEYIVSVVFIISIADRAKTLLINLKETTEQSAREKAEKERISTELNIATQIQAGMLPCIFPAFPERLEFDIYASMQPAKEVGGDFYDFFLIDENTLALIIADVSGKGVPAALFMVIAKTLIKNNAQYGKSPKEVFETVNNLLYENNEAGMFVTAFLGYLDITSGKFTFVNAGHNPPILYSGEYYNWLKVKTGFVLAGMEDIYYEQSEITLKPEDELFLYTDGITEAVNNEKKLFGDKHLLETMNKYTNLSLKEFTMSLKQEIVGFAEGAEQADDITMLVLRYKGIKK